MCIFHLYENLQFFHSPEAAEPFGLDQFLTLWRLLISDISMLSLPERHRPRVIALVLWSGMSLRWGAVRILDFVIKRAGQAPTAELLIRTSQ